MSFSEPDDFYSGSWPSSRGRSGHAMSRNSEAVTLYWHCVGRGAQELLKKPLTRIPYHARKETGDGTPLLVLVRTMNGSAENARETDLASFRGVCLSHNNDEQSSRSLGTMVVYLDISNAVAACGAPDLLGLHDVCARTAITHKRKRKCCRYTPGQSIGNDFLEHASNFHNPRPPVISSSPLPPY